MSERRFDRVPFDEEDRRALERLEYAERTGTLTQQDGSLLLDAVHFLRYEVEAARYAIGRLEDHRGGYSSGPELNEDVAAWVERRLEASAKNLVALRIGDRADATAGARELRLTSWPILGILAPAVRKLRQRQAALSWDGSFLVGPDGLVRVRG